MIMKKLLTRFLNFISVTPLHPTILLANLYPLLQKYTVASAERFVWGALQIEETIQKEVACIY